MSVPAVLQLRSFPISAIPKRVAQWWRRIANYKGEPVPAAKLYAGDHWAVIKALLGTAQEAGFQTKLWVISTGYGLVPSDGLLHPYSATFSTGHSDSITDPIANGRSRQASIEWWKALSTLKSRDSEPPHSLMDLVSADPDGHFLIVTSPDYLAAIEEDLLGCVELITNPDRLLIVTSRKGFRTQSLKRHLVPSDARLQPLLGGSRSSLNARVARMIVANAKRWGFSATRVKKEMDRLITRSPRLARIERQRVSDHQLKRFIHRELSSKPEHSCSALLRKFRDSNRACEQSRFKKMFLAVKEDLQ